MLCYDGFRIIKIANGNYSGFVVPDGIVEYQPGIKYRIEKKNAFDPTIIIRKEPYRIDSIECEALLDASDYDLLVEQLTNADQLYIEIDAADATLQFPVTTDKLPKLEDESRSHRGRVKFTLKSIYQQLNPIDFDSVFGWGNNWGINFGF